MTLEKCVCKCSVMKDIKEQSVQTELDEVLCQKAESIVSNYDIVEKYMKQLESKNYMLSLYATGLTIVVLLQLIK